MTTIADIHAIIDRESPQVQRAILSLARARIYGDSKNVVNATDRMRKMLLQTRSLADLMGRAWLLKMSRDQMMRNKFAARDSVSPVVDAPTFQQAVDAILKREPVLARTYREAIAAHKRYAIAFARSADIQITKRIQELLADAVRTGMGEVSAREKMQDIAGWTPGYADTVYRNNVSSAYSDGMIQQARESDGMVVAFEIDGIRDSDQRPNHRAFNGIVVGIDDPLLPYCMPPFGHRCRCSPIPITVFEARRRNLLMPNGRVRPVTLPPNARRDPGFDVGGAA